MPLRALLRYLLNNEQVIQKIADSYPIRRAAQLTAFMLHKGKEVGMERMDKMKQEAGKKSRKLESFSNRFQRELEDGFKDMKEEMKKKDR